MTEASGLSFKATRLCHKQGYFIFRSEDSGLGQGSWWGCGKNGYLQKQGSHIAEG